MTEAGILVGGWDLDRLPRCVNRCVKKWLLELSAMGPSKIVITGMDLLPDQIGVACYDVKTATTDIFYNDSIDGYFPGTGDLFSSVFLGSYLNGLDLGQSARKAADFVKKCGGNHSDVRRKSKRGRAVRKTFAGAFFIAN